VSSDMPGCRFGVAGDEWKEMRGEQLWGWAICRGRAEMKDRGLGNLGKDLVGYAVLMLMSLNWESTIFLGAGHIEGAAGLCRVRGIR
jgi:hypothetical protein